MECCSCQLAARVAFTAACTDRRHLTACLQCLWNQLNMHASDGFSWKLEVLWPIACSSEKGSTRLCWKRPVAQGVGIARKYKWTKTSTSWWQYSMPTLCQILRPSPDLQAATFEIKHLLVQISDSACILKRMPCLRITTIGNDRTVVLFLSFLRKAFLRVPC